MNQPDKAISFGLKTDLNLKKWENLPDMGVSRMYYGQVIDFWQKR